MTVRFSYVNLADAADLSASSEVSTLPATNLQDPRPTRIWRAEGASNESVVFDLGQAASATLAVLLEHNLTSNATVLLQANGSDSWDDPAFESELLWHEQIIIKFFAATSYRYWRLAIADAANPDGFIQAGRFWLGNYFQPERDFSRDFSIARVDPSPVVYSDSGSRSAGERTPYRSVSLLFPGTDEKAEFEEMIAAVGRSKDLMVALDPESTVWSDGLHGYSVYCHLERDAEWVHKVGDRWALRLNLRETI
jgi:hypothetical protein